MKLPHRLRSWCGVGFAEVNVKNVESTLSFELTFLTPDLATDSDWDSYKYADAASPPTNDLNVGPVSAQYRRTLLFYV